MAPPTLLDTHALVTFSLRYVRAGGPQQSCAMPHGAHVQMRQLRHAFAAYTSFAPSAFATPVAVLYARKFSAFFARISYDFAGLRSFRSSFRRHVIAGKGWLRRGSDAIITCVGGLDARLNEPSAFLFPERFFVLVGAVYRVPRRSREGPQKVLEGPQKILESPSKILVGS